VEYVTIAKLTRSATFFRRARDCKIRRARDPIHGYIYRASKVIGSSVVNEANETIGKIDDLLVSRDGKQPYAVLSIGGFLGRGAFAWLSSPTRR
jgi:hypothetical protein